MTNNNDPFQLIPPYCPNPNCLFHFGTKDRFYIKFGWTKTDKPPFKNQRYRCKGCKILFSNNTFSLEFRKRIIGHSEFIHFSTLHGVSNNSISKFIKVSEALVRDRIKLLAKQAIIFEKQNLPIRVNEDVAYDGFETFTHSQFSPCYVNTAVGSRSMFIYHNTFSPLNRKGRMTDEQKQKNKELIQIHGPYPSNSVYEESKYIMKSLSEKGAGYTLFMDQHKAYQRAVKSFDFRMNVETINSEVRRDPSNPLFPINHLHMIYRQFFSSQKRETISFQKNEAALMDKIQLMKINLNFMKPKFVRKNSYDVHAHEWSPAMYVGAAEKLLNFKEVFSVRKLSSQVRLDDRELAFMRRSYPYSRQVIAA